MFWFYPALATAFVAAFDAAAQKRLLSQLPTKVMTAYPSFYSWPIFAAGALYALTTPFPGRDFWVAVLALAPVNLTAYVLAMYSLKTSPISLTLPLQSFTPPATLLIEYWILDVVPHVSAYPGVLLVALGSWVLYLEGLDRKSLIKPFRAILSDRGALAMLGASVLFGLTSVLCRKLILEASVWHATFTFTLVQNTLFLGILFLLGVRLRDVTAMPGRGAAAGLFYACHITLHFFAQSLTTTGVMIAVKRLNGLFGVILGGAAFQESNIRTRLVGAALMSAGAAVIALWR